MVVKLKYYYYKSANENLRVHLEDLYKEKKIKEDQIHAMEAQIDDLHKVIQDHKEMKFKHHLQAFTQKINELGDDEQRSASKSLINENKELIAKINQKINDIEKLNAKLSQADKKLRKGERKNYAFEKGN